MFQHPFSFKGRIRRLEYGLSLLLYVVLVGLLNIFAPGEHAPPDAQGALVGLLAVVTVPPALWFIVAQGAKRCHDRNATGFFQVIPYYILWMLFAPGQRSPNDYGPDPKVPSAAPATVYPAVGDELP